jgi:hypothetical protein
MRALILAAAAVATLSGCATRPGVPDAAAPAARLAPEEDLVGRLYGRGAFRSLTGPRRAFDVTLDGSWDGTTLTLVEVFRYADGENDTKTWKLRKLADGSYEGAREDTVGLARGWIEDGAYRMAYTMAIPKKGGGARHVRFQDVLVEDVHGAILNRARVSYLGLPVASVDLTMQRTPFP